MDSKPSNVRYDGNRAVISIKGITDSLKGILSDTDIVQTNSVIRQMREKQKFMSLMLSRNGCNNGDGCIYNDKFNKCVPYGDYHSDVMFIRKMPTELEQVCMLSHSDAPSYILFTALRKAGFSPDDFYFTDFLKCYGGDRIDPRACVHCMQEFLFKELEFVNPKLIIAEGSEVMKALNARVFESQVPISPGVSEVTTVLNGNLVSAAAIFDPGLIIGQTDPNVIEQKKHGLWVQLNTLLEPYKKGNSNGQGN